VEAQEEDTMMHSRRPLLIARPSYGVGDYVAVGDDTSALPGILDPASWGTSNSQPSPTTTQPAQTDSGTGFWGSLASIFGSGASAYAAQQQAAAAQYRAQAAASGATPSWLMPVLLVGGGAVLLLALSGRRSSSGPQYVVAKNPARRRRRRRARRNPAGLTKKGERMYRHIRDRYRREGEPRAKEIAARTVYARAKRERGLVRGR
jgi:hypothetical protein